MVQFLNPGMAMVDCLVDIETIIFLEHINLASRVKLANLFLGRLNIMLRSKAPAELKYH